MENLFESMAVLFPRLKDSLHVHLLSGPVSINSQRGIFLEISRNKHNLDKNTARLGGCGTPTFVAHCNVHRPSKLFSPINSVGPLWSLHL